MTPALITWLAFIREIPLIIHTYITHPNISYVNKHPLS